MASPHLLLHLHWVIINTLKTVCEHSYQKTNTKHTRVNPGKGIGRSRSPRNTQIEKEIAIAFKFIQYYKSRCWIFTTRGRTQPANSLSIATIGSIFLFRGDQKTYIWRCSPVHAVSNSLHALWGLLCLCLRFFLQHEFIKLRGQRDPTLQKNAWLIDMGSS